MVAYQYVTPASLPWGFLTQRKNIEFDARRGFVLRDRIGNFTPVILYSLVGTAHEIRLVVRSKWPRIVRKVWKDATGLTSHRRFVTVSSYGNIATSAPGPVPNWCRLRPTFGRGGPKSKQHRSNGRSSSLSEDLECQPTSGGPVTPCMDMATERSGFSSSHTGSVHAHDPGKKRKHTRSTAALAARLETRKRRIFFVRAMSRKCKESPISAAGIGSTAASAAQPAKSICTAGVNARPQVEMD